VPEYTEAFKAKMVRKMLPPDAVSANALAAETGIHQPTLSRWLREARYKGVMDKPKKKWTPAEKLRVLAEVAQVDDKDLGEFLRREGLHEEQLQEWRTAAEAALDDKTAPGNKKSADAKRIKQLESELRRKDKALAEASALLVLKKKAAAIWGDEDDDTTDESDR
jgi:transposase-like protein